MPSSHSRPDPNPVLRQDISYNEGGEVTPATVVEAFVSRVRDLGDAVAIRDQHLDPALTWREYGAMAHRAAAGLRAAGVVPGDTVGLLLSNRPEFHVADVAALLAGATPFSLYQTCAPEQLAEILRNANCRVVITEAGLARALDAALDLDGVPVQHVVTVGTESWGRLLSDTDTGLLAASGTSRTLPCPTDAATVIYTSGTTGAPKGVVLTHQSIMSTTTALAQRLGMRRDNWSVSYLPMAHIAERISTHYSHILVGSTVVCCPDQARLIPVLKDVQPEIFFAPPRIWEKLQALTAGERAAGTDHVHIRRGIGLARSEVALTGAAPCPPGVIEYFHGIGVPLREIYGMSETSGVISLGEVDDIGSVGKPFPGTEVRIADDGELLVRGPSVMVGYRARPDATAAALDGAGWLHTGDVGQIDGDGRIRIVDRKKDLIINSSGKNMSPANIEARLRESGHLIDHACVIGDGRPYNVALIVVDPVAAETFPGLDELTVALWADIDRANQRLARVEQVKRFTVLPGPWHPGSDELTPTMKLRRAKIMEKYAGQIEELYAARRTRAVMK